ncbi:MAG: hypothetical protein KGI33_07370 [Thaumarchaeota archaeon]|nr:hypothetical protein [Nitrososphaerota archaeon]
MGNIDPNSLQFWADKPHTPPFKIDGKPVKLIATQKSRRKPTDPTNFVYNITGTRIIVYNQSQNSPAFMKIAPDNDMESYAMRFLDKSDPDWLKLNDYILC